MDNWPSTCRWWFRTYYKELQKLVWRIQTGGIDYNHSPTQCDMQWATAGPQVRQSMRQTSHKTYIYNPLDLQPLRPTMSVRQTWWKSQERDNSIEGLQDQHCQSRGPYCMSCRPLALWAVCLLGVPRWNATKLGCITYKVRGPKLPDVLQKLS